MALHPIKTRRTFEVISDQIRDEVRSGMLGVGDRLPNEREMAKSLSVSRHAVREALRGLESLGVIRLQKGAYGGAFISGGRPESIGDVLRGMFYVGGISVQHLTEARLWIETILVRVVAQRASPKDYKLLLQNVAEAEAATRAGDLVRKTELNIQFHSLLADMSHNPVFAVVMAALLNVLREFVSQVGSVMGMDVIQSRRRLIAHMQKRDAERAIAEMQKHLKILGRHYENAAREIQRGSASPVKPGETARRKDVRQ